MLLVELLLKTILKRVLLLLTLNLWIGPFCFATYYCEIYPTRSYTGNYTFSPDLHFDANASEQIHKTLELKAQANYEHAFADMSQLAESSDHPVAYFNLAQFERKGLGTSRNWLLAREHYRKAALRGSLKAQVNLGLLTYQMDGALIEGQNPNTIPEALQTQDRKEALYWLLTAISLGERHLDEFLEQMIQQKPEYDELLQDKYPRFLDENQMVYSHIDRMLNFLHSRRGELYDKVKTYYERSREVADRITIQLGQVECLLKKMKHFYRFNETDYLLQVHSQLLDILDETYSLFQRRDLKLSAERLRRQFRRAIRRWVDELIPEIYEQLKYETEIKNISNKRRKT